MIIKYKAKFQSKTQLPRYLGMAFQSILLTTLGNDLANALHEGPHSLRPYRSSVYQEHDSYIWELVALNEELADIIKNKSQELFTKHKLNSFNTDIDYSGELNIVETSHDILFKEFYSSTFIERNRVTINFKTPTSIKTRGRYLHYPQEDMILFSLLKKWDEFSDSQKLYDPSLYESIIECFSIHSIKNLKSQFIPIDKGKVSGFIGTVDFKIKSPTRQINQLINLLLEYGNYSGIGIKTGMGMGNIEVNDFVQKKSSNSIIY